MRVDLCPVDPSACSAQPQPALMLEGEKIPRHLQLRFTAAPKLRNALQTKYHRMTLHERDLSIKMQSTR